MLFRENDPWHFGSLHLALLSLFRASTLEDWTDIMYINMLGCDQYGYDGMEAQCTHPTPTGTLAMIYFIFIVVVGALIMLTLFVGVVTTSMEQAKEETESEINVEKRLIEFKKLNGQQVEVGCRVKIKNHDLNEINEYTILGPWDTNENRSYISYLSAVAQAVMGQKVGQKSKHKLPGAETDTTFEVLEINVPDPDALFD